MMMVIISASQFNLKNSKNEVVIDPKPFVQVYNSL